MKLRGFSSFLRDFPVAAAVTSVRLPKGINVHRAGSISGCVGINSQVLAFADCLLARDPLVQLTCIGPKPGLAGHFRGVSITNSRSGNGGVIDFGGGPRTNKTEHPVNYYFHDLPAVGTVTRVTNAGNSSAGTDVDNRRMDDWTGREARAATVRDVSFPELLTPIDDLSPPTLITNVATEKTRRILRGVAHDDGEIATVTVNGTPAQITSQHAGVAEWTITLETPSNGRFLAQSVDRSGNAEKIPHQLCERVAH